jgi:glycosyltransferase involved in cell wall biosynthesis
MSMKDTLRIHSNFKRYDSLLSDSDEFLHEYIGEDSDLFTALRTVLRAMFQADYLILNLDHRRLLLACALFGLLSPRPFRRCSLISVDLLLRPESGWRGSLKMAVKSLLLRQVDTIFLYFRNWDGYCRHYRLSRERMRFVPFKVNSWERLSARAQEPLPESYVLCAGATHRDHRTFVESVRLSGVPALLLLPGPAPQIGPRHDWLKPPLPPNLRVEYHEGDEESYLRYFESAAIVCLPRYRWDIASTGSSAALCAAGLGKCVVISCGPGGEDVFAGSGAAVFFEPENPVELSQQLRGLWGNKPLRQKIGRNAFQFAKRLRGEDRLLRDVLAGLDSAIPAGAKYACPPR